MAGGAHDSNHKGWLADAGGLFLGSNVPAWAAGATISSIHLNSSGRGHVNVRAAPNLARLSRTGAARLSIHRNQLTGYMTSCGHYGRAVLGAEWVRTWADTHFRSEGVLDVVTSRALRVLLITGTRTKLHVERWPLRSLVRLPVTDDPVWRSGQS